MFYPSGVVAAASFNNLVDLVGASVSDIRPSGTAFSRYAINDDKEETERSQSPTTSINTWLAAGNPSDYEVQFEATGDQTSPQLINTWYGAETNPSWRIEQSSPGNKSTSGQIICRRKLDQAEQDRASLSLFAEVTP